MEARICYCCGGKLEKASSDNPNVCRACAHWPLPERGYIIEMRTVELVPVEDDGIISGSPSWN